MQEDPETFKQLRWVHRMDPPYYVNSTAISANGERVVAGTYVLKYKPPEQAQTSDLPMQFGTFCFNRDGKALWADRFQGTEGVYAVAMSADGSTAVSGGRLAAVDGFIRVYDTKAGEQLANYPTGARVNQLALSQDGTVVLAGADQVYLAEQKNGSFPTDPQTYAVNSSTNNNVQSVSMPYDGSYFVVGDYAGTVYMIENNSGSFGQAYQSATGLLGTVHCVAVSNNGEWFIAVGGSQDVYLFNAESIQQGQFVDKFTLPTSGRVGWAAISLLGDMISVVQNNVKTGFVYALQNQNGVLSQLWSQLTLANPNSTSLDASGEHITVADGYPDGTTGHFYLFNGLNGDAFWTFETLNMNWPMFISSFGTGIVAGTDHGNVYYFNP